MSWEFLAAVCTVIATVFGIYAYYNRRTPEYKEAKKYMLSQLDFLTRLNASVLEQYETFARNYDAYDVQISEGLTFRFGIDKMRMIKAELTPENAIGLQRTKGSLRDIESLTDNFKKQIEYHSGLQTTLEIFQNHINLNHPYMNANRSDK